MRQRFGGNGGDALGLAERSLSGALRRRRRLGNGARGGVVRLQRDDLRRQRLGSSRQRRRFARQIGVALVHLGDAPRRLACARAPALRLRRHPRQPLSRGAHVAVEPGAFGPRRGDRGPPRIRFARQRLHAHARRAAIGERRLCRRRARDLRRCFILLRHHALAARGKIGALRFDPLDRGGRAVLAPRRVARGRFGAFERAPRRLCRRTRCANCRIDPRKLAVRRRHGIHRSGPHRLDRAQPVNPLQPLGRRRTTRFGDIAIPAPQHARHRHQPLPHGQRHAVIGIRHEHLRQPPRERRRCRDMRRQRHRAARRIRVARRHRRARPEPLARRIEARLEIVAQRGRQRAFIPRIGPHLVEQPLASIPPGRLGQRRRLAVERGQIGMRGRTRRLRAVALVDAPTLIRIGAGQRGTHILDLAQRLRSCRRRHITLGKQRGRIAERRNLRRHARQIARAPLGAHPRRRQRRLRHARIRRLGRLRGQRLRQRHLSIAPGALGLAQPRFQIGHARNRLGQPRLQRLALGSQPRNRLGGIAGERAFARAILGQPHARRSDFGHAPRRRRLLAAQSTEPMPGLARRLAQRQRLPARRRQRLGRRQGVRRRRALRLGSVRNARLARRRFCFGRIGGSLRIAPARKDHPRLGDTDLIGQRAIALGLPRLAAQRVGARVLIGDQLVEPGEIDLGRA